MATGRKKLSSAKAKTAAEGLDTLLRDTGHDQRLAEADRVLLERAAGVCRTLETVLLRDELAS